MRTLKWGRMQIGWSWWKSLFGVEFKSAWYSRGDLLLQNYTVRCPRYVYSEQNLRGGFATLSALSTHNLPLFKISKASGEILQFLEMIIAT